MVLRLKGLESDDGGLGSQLLGSASTTCLSVGKSRECNMQERK